MCTTVTGFLASIKDIREAKLIASSEVDIIDLKNIDDGALGFVGRNFISKVRKILPRHTLSATMGNHMNPNNSENIENIKFVIKNKILRNSTKIYWEDIFFLHFLQFPPSKK